MIAITAIGVAISTQPFAQTDEKSTLLVLGDSLSSAYGMATDEGWVSLLAQRLRSLHENGQLPMSWSVVNASIAGDTATAGAERIEPLLARHNPDLVIVELGGNDGLRGTPVTTIRAALEEILDSIDSFGARPVLVEIWLPPNYGPRYVTEFQAVYRNLAKERGVDLVPFPLADIATQPGMMQPDRVHPTAAAGPTMLNTVWTVLEALL